MARSVSLSDSAFAALRAEKRQGESDSDVVVRLRDEARQKRKDPARFFDFNLEPAADDAMLDVWRKKMDEASRRNPWDE